MSVALGCFSAYRLNFPLTVNLGDNSQVDFQALAAHEDSKFVHELLREADESEAKNFIDDLFI